MKHLIQETGNKGFMVKLRYNEDLRNKVIELTSFLQEAASLSERVYCILHDITEQPVCKWCSDPLRFQKLDKGYFATCGKKECKSKGIAAGAANHGWAAVAAKVKATNAAKPKKPKIIKPKPPVYTRQERCWDNLLSRIDEMGFNYKETLNGKLILECKACGTLFEIERSYLNIHYRTNNWKMCPKCQYKDSTFRPRFEKEICTVVNQLVPLGINVLTNKYINKFEVDIKTDSGKWSMIESSKALTARTATTTCTLRLQASTYDRWKEAVPTLDTMLSTAHITLVKV